MLPTRRVQLANLILILVSVCSVSQTSAPAPKTAERKPIPHATVDYVNNQFGFRFTLPADWKGYSIVMTEWGGSGDTANVKGPMLSIRNPHSTEKNPWQDIPIMIFTHRQWSLVRDGRLTVSAAPYDPGELGRNRRYVFALPPRYNFDEDPGYEEVIQIMSGNPLHAF